MPNTEFSKRLQRSQGDNTLKDARFLDKLIELLNTPVKKYRQQNEAETGSPQRQGSSKANMPSFTKEMKLLKHFGSRYKDQRLFSQTHFVDKFIQIFRELIKSRLCNRTWNENAMPENFLRLFQCLRLLLRDQNFQKELHNYDGLKVIAENLKVFTDQHVTHGGDEILIDILKEIVNICQKLSAETHQRSSVVSHEIHKSLGLLLHSNSLVIIHLALFALIALTKSEEIKEVVSQLNFVERLLQIVSDYDVSSKQVASTFLRQLCTIHEIKEQINLFNGIPILLSLLRSDALKLLWNVVCILVHLAENHVTSNNIRLLGGIPLLVSLLQERPYLDDQNEFANSSRAKSTDVLNLKSAVCAALTQLILNDTNARHLLQANGIYYVALYIFTGKSLDERADMSTTELQLQKNAFRTLRFMFSMERNRQLFKRIFPPELFEMFIDVGHYQQDLDTYDQLVQNFNKLNDDKIAEIRSRVHTVNQNKEPASYIQQYAVYEHLGSGAFGSVYKVKKKGGQTFLAMKEISTHHPEFGKSTKERNSNADGIINECSFVKKQMNHTNIVKYHKAFLEGDKLYVIMDLIDGAPLGEHFNALKEKQQTFSEDRLWNIFVQMVLALRYIHKEKSIVHRDLTPNNIMLGEEDKVTVTDFGLARQKSSDASKLTSMVGTIVYSCPEVVRGMEYGEKADIWALGCILYQMASLEPPFFSSNMLSLATKIVEGSYEALPDGLYSPLVALVIKRCLTVKAEQRPDVLEVASLIPDVLIYQMETLRIQNNELERRLEKEKKRLQRHTDDLKNYRLVHNGIFQQQYDDSFSEQSCNNTQDSDTQSDIIYNMRARNLSYTNKYERPLLDYENDKRPRKASGNAVSRPIRINGRNRTELVSTSGSYDSNNEEDVFKNGKAGKKYLQNNSSNTDNSSDRNAHVKRTQSCSYIDALEKTPTKHRPTSAQATLAMSPRRVRVIDDPILQMLSQLHKIIYLSQLPPPLKYDGNRRIIDQYKRKLFSAPNSALALKNELKKLIEGSKEHVDVPLTSFDTSSRFSSSLSNVSENSLDSGVTYEELKTILEMSLLDFGYYNHIPQSSRTKPPGLATFTSKPVGQ